MPELRDFVEFRNVYSSSRAIKYLKGELLGSHQTSLLYKHLDGEKIERTSGGMLEKERLVSDYQVRFW